MSDDADPTRAELLRVEVHYDGSDATLVLDGGPGVVAAALGWAALSALVAWRYA